MSRKTDRVAKAFTICALFACAAFGQSDRGTITGTVTDATGAVIPGAAVTATNPSTGNVLETVTTATGNYTLGQVPVGLWDVTVESPGFNTYTSTQHSIAVAQTIRVNASLQVGDTNTTITVEADAVALQTEDAAVGTSVSNEEFVELPIAWANGFYGNQAVRNPLSVAQLMPGMGGGAAYFNTLGLTGGGASVNGAPAGTFKVLLDGQESTNLYAPGFFFYQQPSVESLEAVNMQTSNYAAEFGQAQGGIFNFTAKSGTNEYHGGAFYRLTNEVLNARVPYTGARNPSRQNNFGATFGGPVYIPGVYDGRNKTFFFFSYEGFRSVLPAPASGSFTTVPTAADRMGDFSAALGDQVNCGGPCVDGLGNPIHAGQIYNPYSLASDGFTRLPFNNNMIPEALMDPVALKIQSMLPQPINGLQANNFQLFQTSRRPENLPSVKIDHNVSNSLKLSGFWSYVGGAGQTSTDGLPQNITQAAFNTHLSHTVRLNVDKTIGNSTLLHWGGGYVRTVVHKHSFPEVKEVDAARDLGLNGPVNSGFPTISGLGNFSAAGAPVGGMNPSIGARFWEDVPTGQFNTSLSLSMITGSHSLKFGGTFQTRGQAFIQNAGTWGVFGFDEAQSGQPFSAGGGQLATTNGAPGLGYASFLLGLPNSASVSPTTYVNWREQSIAGYVQDNWKATNKLTFDLGLRYDYMTPPRENRDRINSFDPNTPNPSADSLLGSVLYQGFGPNTCNCKNILDTYKYAFGPRIGVAYQLTSKTVIRGGWGFFFGTPSTFLGGAPRNPGAGNGYDTITFGSPGPGAPALPNGLEGGIPVDESLFSANLKEAGAYPTLNPITGVSNLNEPDVWDPALGRPPRIAQFNLTLQHQFTPGITVEVAYVGNRGAWLLGGLNPINAVTPEILAANGLSLSNPAHQTLLRSRMNSSAVQNAGFGLPFSTYPETRTLADALRPYPQYRDALNPDAPIGNSWYDSLQMKGNIRLRRNLTGLVTYTWAKSQNRLEPFNDWTNFSTQRVLDENMRPQSLSMSFMYQTPHLERGGGLGGNKVMRAVFSDWQVSAVLRYQSGDLIDAPDSNNNLDQYLASAPDQYMTRVPGEPLYLVDINGDIDPTQQLVLNPDAWAECGPTATFGCGAPRYGDFRQRRVPQENIGLGRRFALKENVFFELRFEMYNPFNRLVHRAIRVGNPTTSARYNSDGRLTGGFGFIDYNRVSANSPRNMLINGRLSF